MKVVIINGSPRKSGNCSMLAERFTGKLAENDIDSEILQIGSMDIKGCKACWACAETHKCVQNDKAFHEAASKVYEADGLLIISPVYYDSMPGQLKSFLDRLFFQDRSGGGLRGKAGAAITVQRRSGGVSTLDDIYHYLLCAGVLVVPSEGESIVYGLDPGDVGFDQEGLDIADNLATYMVWLIRMMKQTEGTLTKPQIKKRAQTNFIR